MGGLLSSQTVSTGGQTNQTDEIAVEERPRDVGILAIDVYFPRNKVNHEALEKYDKVAEGKYTIGLGQKSMAYTEDQEDVVSMSLTVVQNLMEKYEIQPETVGRLEVGTESSIDRSKSVKSFLMALFRGCGNSDVQGVDCINACYGGTAALFNAVNWVESRSWDGRYAIVVAADVAVYASGPARPSGGCGAVAMLIGPGAPLVLQPGYSAAHMDDVYDFYKPAGIFPQVQGRLSIACYLTAVDRCYVRLCRKIDKLRQQSSNGASRRDHQSFSLADVDYCVMHVGALLGFTIALHGSLIADRAPFAKMVRKGFARLVIQDFLRARQGSHAEASTSDPVKACTGVEQSVNSIPCMDNGRRSSASLPGSDAVAATELDIEKTSKARLLRALDQFDPSTAEDVLDRGVEQAAIELSTQQFERLAAPGMLLGVECGNMYAASVHASLASLVYNKYHALEGKCILASSFGSGLAASIFCIKAKKVEGRFSLANIANKLDLRSRLDDRRAASPEEFNEAIAMLESSHGKAGLRPKGTPEHLFPGTYYLQEIDELFRRKYQRKQ